MLLLLDIFLVRSTPKSQHREKKIQPAASTQQTVERKRAGASTQQKSTEKASDAGC